MSCPDHPRKRIVMLLVDGRHVSTVRTAKPLQAIAAELLARHEDAERVEVHYQSAGRGRWCSPGDRVVLRRTAEAAR